MNHKRNKMQNGSLRKVKRAENDWAWEYRYYDPVSGKPRSVCLRKEDYPTEADVQPYIASFADRLNAERTFAHHPWAFHPTLGPE